MKKFYLNEQKVKRNKNTFSKENLNDLKNMLEKHGMNLSEVTKFDNEWSARMSPIDGSLKIAGFYQPIYGKTFDDLVYNLHVVATSCSSIRNSTIDIKDREIESIHKDYEERVNALNKREEKLNQLQLELNLKKSVIDGVEKRVKKM